MLAATENALVAALKAHRLVQALKLRTVSSLPKEQVEKLLARYVADAPALYVLPGMLKGDGDDFAMTFVIVGVVRNVAGNAKARKGDGISIGCDHLLIAAARALHGHSVGGCSWALMSAEMTDDEIFDKTGLAAIEMTFKSGNVEVPDDLNADDLDAFITFHADDALGTGASGMDVVLPQS